ncbi:CLUMA_CG012470, isoform A [Clunio marinus]|uniref:CLUMA_CG012470, isoform A n=1 Tax=Clunio marinus TaxID=568069 RepID=A0A1J1IFJ4_9DIPT|nr:CLUMA_CG012470, isoform A [Clunio marinus]
MKKEENCHSVYLNGNILFLGFFFPNANNENFWDDADGEREQKEILATITSNIFIKRSWKLKKGKLYQAIFYRFPPFTSRSLKLQSVELSLIKKMKYQWRSKA